MTTINYASFPHIVERILEFADKDVLHSFRSTCSKIRFLADKRLVEHIAVGYACCCTEVLTYSHPHIGLRVHGARIPCLPWEYKRRCGTHFAADGETWYWAPPKMLRHVRIVDVGHDITPFMMESTRYFLRGAEVMRHFNHDEFYPAGGLYPFIRAKKLIHFLLCIPETDDTYVSPVTVPYGVKHFVVTVPFAQGGRDVNEIKYERARPDGTHRVKTVTIIYRPNKYRRDHPQPEIKDTVLGLESVLRQCAAELGSVTYTFVGLDEYLESHSLTPIAGPGTIHERHHRAIVNRIKEEVRKLGTYDESLFDAKVYTHAQYLEKVGSHQYDLETCPDWEEFGFLRLD